MCNTTIFKEYIKNEALDIPLDVVSNDSEFVDFLYDHHTGDKLERLKSLEHFHYYYLSRSPNLKRWNSGDVLHQWNNRFNSKIQAKGGRNE